MMNKKGLSAVVASLLIVLITIAAVLIVWQVVKTNIEDTASQLSQADCINVDVKLNSCNLTGTYSLTYAAGSLSKLVVTVEGAPGNDVNETLPVLGTTVTRNPGMTSASRVSAVAFLSDEISCGVVAQRDCA